MGAGREVGRGRFRPLTDPLCWLAYYCKGPSYGVSAQHPPRPRLTASRAGRPRSSWGQRGSVSAASCNPGGRRCRLGTGTIHLRDASQGTEDSYKRGFPGPANPNLTLQNRPPGSCGHSLPLSLVAALARLWPRAGASLSRLGRRGREGTCSWSRDIPGRSFRVQSAVLLGRTHTETGKWVWGVQVYALHGTLLCG